MTVKLRPPASLAGLTHGIGLGGEYFLGADGLVEVAAADVAPLLAGGFSFPVSQMSTGTAPPAAAAGFNGDFYLQTTADPTKFAVFRKAGGTWGTALVDTGVGG